MVQEASRSMLYAAAPKRFRYKFEKSFSHTVQCSQATKPEAQIPIRA